MLHPGSQMMGRYVILTVTTGDKERRLAASRVFICPLHVSKHPYSPPHPTSLTPHTSQDSLEYLLQYGKPNYDADS